MNLQFGQTLPWSSLVYVLSVCLTIPDCRGEEFSRSNAVLLYDLCGHALTQDTIRQIKEIYNLVDPSLVIITLHLVCLNDAPELRRVLKKNGIFTL